MQRTRGAASVCVDCASLLCECGSGSEIGPEDWADGSQAADNDLRAAMITGTTACLGSIYVPELLTDHSSLRVIPALEMGLSDHV
jgi:hypothetical protein